MAFTDDIADTNRATVDALGEPVTYRAQDGTAVTPNGIFDLPSALVQGDGELAVEARAPTVFLLLADLPTDPELDTPTLTIRGVDYEVKDAKPDGVGGIVLVLGKVT
jgi:hypothetical protein